MTESAATKRCRVTAKPTRPIWKAWVVLQVLVFLFSYGGQYDWILLVVCVGIILAAVNGVRALIRRWRTWVK